MNDITDAAVRTLVTELVGKALWERFGIELKETKVSGHPEAVERAGVERPAEALPGFATTVAGLGEGVWRIAPPDDPVGPGIEQYKHLWYQACNRLRALTEHRDRQQAALTSEALERATPDELLAALLTHPDISETDPTHELARAVIRALYDAL